MIWSDLRRSLCSFCRSPQGQCLEKRSRCRLRVYYNDGLSSVRTSNSVRVFDGNITTYFMKYITARPRTVLPRTCDHVGLFHKLDSGNISRTIQHIDIATAECRPLIENDIRSIAWPAANANVFSLWCRCASNDHCRWRAICCDS